MSRIVVNVATGHYVKGQRRLLDSLGGTGAIRWTDELPEGSPTHKDVPYAFKAYALEWARKNGYTQILWTDASIVALKSLDTIWDYSAEHGVWFANNGWNNAQWTCDAAYPLLFPLPLDDEPRAPEWKGSDTRGLELRTLEVARRVNSRVPHVVATAFAIDLNHKNGQTLVEQQRRASRLRIKNRRRTVRTS